MAEPNIQEQSDEIEIDIVELMGVLLSKLWLLIVSTVVFAAATFLINMYLITPKYESVTKIYIINRQSNETLTYSDLQSGTQLTKDYQELVKARPVLEEVRAELSLEQDNDELADQIEVSVPTDTRIVTITIEDPDPYMARDIANAVRDSASAHIENVMATEAINVVEDANLPTKPSSPKILRNTAIGALIGLLFAVAIILIVYIMDDTIKNPDDIENYLGLSVLGSIPDNSEEARKKRKKLYKRTHSGKHKEEEYHSKNEYTGISDKKSERDKNSDDTDKVSKEKDRALKEKDKALKEVDKASRETDKASKETYKDKETDRHKVTEAKNVSDNNKTADDKKVTEGKTADNKTPADNHSANKPLERKPLRRKSDFSSEFGDEKDWADLKGYSPSLDPEVNNGKTPLFK